MTAIDDFQYNLTTNSLLNLTTIGRIRLSNMESNFTSDFNYHVKPIDFQIILSKNESLSNETITHLK